MKRLSLIIVLLFVVFTVTGFGGEDARYLKREVTFTLNPDGGWTEMHRRTVKLFTPLAATRLAGETFIEYNPEFQAVKVLKSETTMRDGRKVFSPPNAFNEVLPRRAHHFPHYAHLREMVVTHTGLEPGAVVQLEYLVKTKPGFMPYFSGRMYLQDRFPSDRTVVNISVPEGKKLNYKSLHLPEEPAVKKESGRTLYTFVFGKFDAYVSESFNRDISRPVFVFSTADHWKSVFPTPGAAGPLPKALMEKAEILKKKAAGDDDLYFKLQGFVAEEISLCRVGPELTGAAFRTLQQVYDSGYANAFEKTLLLYGMLKHLNIPAEITVLPRDRKFAVKVPTLLQVSGYLVKVNTADDGSMAVFLDPVAKQERLFVHKHGGVLMYRMQEDLFAVFSACFGGAGRVDISGKLAAGEKQAGELTVHISGRFFSYRSALADAQKAVAKVVKGVLPVSKVEIKKILRLTAREVVASVSVEGDFFEKLYADRLRIQRFEFPGITDRMFELKERKYPMYLDGGSQYSVKLDIEIPKDMTVTYLAAPVDLKNDAAYFHRKVETGQPGHILMRMGFGINKPVIEPKEYPSFREVAARYYAQEPLVVVKTK